VSHDVPERTCTGCGAKRPKAALLRICARGGGIAIDESSKAPGRGAYICRDAECARKARKKDSLSRSLKVSVPHRMYDDIEALTEGR
jgi:uncharacterized protein